MILGIEASNISSGGGLIHLINILKYYQPSISNFSKIVLWAPKSTLDLISDRPWIIKIHHTVFEKSFVFRFVWQFFFLNNEIKKYKCNLVFVPGGTFFCKFQPFVTMCQNLLPFEYDEFANFGFSFFYLKMLFLKFSQTFTFLRSKGIIFLSKYSVNVLSNICKNVSSFKVIPHGVDQSFQLTPRIAKDITNYSHDKPFKIIYVSIINIYKHQLNVVKAVKKLNDNGFPVELSLVGPVAHSKYNKKLLKYIHNNFLTNVKLVGEVSHTLLINFYKDVDLAIFASSCETFGMILTEYMAAGLPIACSGLSSMPELLGNGGFYFNPYNVNDIFYCLMSLLSSKEERNKVSNNAYILSKQFDWNQTSLNTFNYLNEIAMMYFSKLDK